MLDHPLDSVTPSTAGPTGQTSQPQATLPFLHTMQTSERIVSGSSIETGLHVRLAYTPPPAPRGGGGGGGVNQALIGSGFLAILQAARIRCDERTPAM